MRGCRGGGDEAESTADVIAKEARLQQVFGDDWRLSRGVDRRRQPRLAHVMSRLKAT